MNWCPELEVRSQSLLMFSSIWSALLVQIKGAGDWLYAVL